MILMTKITRKITSLSKSFLPHLQTERNLSRKLTARVKTSGLVEWARAVSVHTESIQSVTMNLELECNVMLQ